VDCLVACVAQSDQVLLRVVSTPAPELAVVDLQIPACSALLTSPLVSLQHAAAQRPIGTVTHARQ
jgi:hypothetical protein